MPTDSHVEPSQIPGAPCWPAVPYGLLAFAGMASAFVGLSTSSYWTDELFTMYVVDPRAGSAQMMQRILEDVHPPLYYFVLDGWIGWFGRSESATRSFSAACAVLALMVFAAGVRRVVRPAAIAFACAVAVTSMFWFDQAQNARSYAWVMLLGAGLLAAALPLYRCARARGDFPLVAWSALSLLAIAASQSHSYMLLGSGMLLLYLIATLPDPRLRCALALSGAVTLGLYLLFLWFQLRAAEHDFSATWFRSDFDFIGKHVGRALRNALSRQAQLVCAVLLVALFVQRWSRRGKDVARPAEDEARWAAGLCACVIAGGIASGIAVTKLFAPSFSFRNVLTFAPFGWLLVARLYDLAGPRARTRAGVAAVVAICALLGWQQVVLARGRVLPRNEPWRASADYVRELKACSAAPITALALPEAYGGLSAALRTLIRTGYYGYYLPPGARVDVLTSPELLQRERAVQAAGASACPLIAWNVHGLGEAEALTLAMALANRPDLRAHGVALQEFESYSLRRTVWKGQAEAFVFLLAEAQTPISPLGDRVLVERLDESSGRGTASFRIQRWRHGRPGRAQRIVVPLDALTLEPLRDWRRIATEVDGSQR